MCAIAAILGTANTQQKRVPGKKHHITATLHMTVQPKWILTKTDPTKTGHPTGFKRTWNLFVSNPVHFKLTDVAKISIKCDYVQYKLTRRHGINIEDDSHSKVRSFILLVIASECVLCLSFVRPLPWINPPATIYNLGIQIHYKLLPRNDRYSWSWQNSWIG